MIYPILMADIINSRKQNSNELMNDFKKIIIFINHKWIDKIVSPLTITLGDEFQGVTDTIDSACKVIFDIEEYIIKNNINLKLRYVLNLGEIDTEVNKNIAYEMLGSGLTLAREKLNELKFNKNRFYIIINSNQKLQEVMNNLFKLYENYIDRWKPKEFHIVKEFLLQRNYQKVAKNLNMNISSSWRRFNSLNIEEYFICKNLILNLNSTLYV